MSFYRTYRPQVIEEIDNEAVRNQLLSLLSKDRSDLPHAYFFTGPKGTGKTTAARVIAKLFNCEKPTKTGPCGSCQQCVSIAKGANLDVIEMDAASNRGIDEIRALRDRLSLAPVSSSYTVYIIDEVHMLTTEAFNALLKTLEEPPAHAIFILATTDAHKVPPTITSRCLIIRFAKAGESELVHALKRIAAAEKIAITDAAIVRIARASDGAFRDAVKFLEQVSFRGGTLDVADIDSALSLAAADAVSAFITLLGSGPASLPDALSMVAGLSSQGIDLRAFIADVLQRLHANLLDAVRVGGSLHLGTRERTQAAIRALTEAYQDARISPVPELPLELAVMDIMEAGGQQPPSYAKEHTAVKDAPKEHLSPRSQTPPPAVASQPAELAHVPLGLLTLEKLVEHWPDFIAATKPYNHSVAGVLRSSRPKSVENGIVVIEAFYKFHQEKLSDIKTRQILADVLKKLFGENVKVEILLGKK